MKPSILIIYTGGTIGMKPDPTTGALVPFDFSGIFEEFPTLQSLNIGIEVFTMDPVIDSSNVSPRNWLDLAAIIRDNYARYDGFVVLHGTDTMSYTASALSFLLENLAKPVVFTGSQIPIGVLRTDGRENLMTAIEIASARIDGRPAVPEVSLYFQNCLFRANRTTKRSSEDLSAFWSYNYPALADVGVNITYHTEYDSPAGALRRTPAHRRPPERRYRRRQALPRHRGTDPARDALGSKGSGASCSKPSAQETPRPANGSSACSKRRSTGD